MSNPLFSTYSQGEDRVTSSILAVFERISFSLVEHILQSLAQEPETSLLTFVNQPKGITSRPDGRIRGSFSYWIETKRVQNAVRKSQIAAHLQALDAETDVERQRLLVLTPDAEEPAALAEIDDERVAWASFDDLLQVIQAVLEPEGGWLISGQPVITEWERNLLYEMVRFLESEGLIGASAQQVVVVAARLALDEYFHHSAYICQPKRSFQPCDYIAFYAEGRISQYVPRILATVESIVLDEETIDARQDVDEGLRTRLRELVRALREEDSFRVGEAQKVMFLSSHDAPSTLILPHDIVNDLASETGRTIAFTQGQRYVPLERLLAAPATTSALL